MKAYALDGTVALGAAVALVLAPLAVAFAGGGGGACCIPAIPEPATMALFAAGSGAVVLLHRMRKRR
jgi:hypothetical protein